MIPKVNIKIDGPTGRHATIEIDGVPIQFSASHAELVIDVNDVSRLEVEHLVMVDEIEIDALVTYRAVLGSRDGWKTRHLSGHGSTPKEAVADLLAQMS